MNEFLDKFAKVPPLQRWFLFLVILALFAGGFYFFFISGVYQKIRNKESQIQNVQAEMEVLNEKKKMRQALLKEIEALQVDLVRVQNQLPDSNQIPNLLQQIHDQARTAGLSIDRFERATDIPKDHYVEIPVKMVLSGNFDQLANFLFYVGRLTRIVNVRDLSIKSTARDFSKQNELGQLTVTALGTTFRYKPKSPAPAPAAKP